MARGGVVRRGHRFNCHTAITRLIVPTITAAVGDLGIRIVLLDVIPAPCGKRISIHRLVYVSGILCTAHAPIHRPRRVEHEHNVQWLRHVRDADELLRARHGRKPHKERIVLRGDRDFLVVIRLQRHRTGGHRLVGPYAPGGAWIGRIADALLPLCERGGVRDPCFFCVRRSSNQYQRRNRCERRQCGQGLAPMGLHCAYDCLRPRTPMLREHSFSFCLPALEVVAPKIVHPSPRGVIGAACPHISFVTI